MFAGSFLHETPLHMWSRLPALFMVGSHSLLREVGYEKFTGLPYIYYNHEVNLLVWKIWVTYGNI
jgi:hypothetical protein